MLVTIDGASRDFPYRQFADAYRERIAAGTMGPKLPSIATLAETAGVSPMTVQKAINVLKAEGLVESRPGLGVFVSGQ